METMPGRSRLIGRKRKNLMKTKRFLKILIACLLVALLAYSGALLLALYNKTECEKILQYYNERYPGQDFYVRASEGHFLAWLSLPPKTVHEIIQTMLNSHDTRFPKYTLREEDLRD